MLCVILVPRWGTMQSVTCESEGREEFFVHVVWLIGEYASSTLDKRCTTEIIDQYVT
jgi:hypothetical protein